MHKLKRLLPVLLALFVVSAFAVYANGQGESTKVSGSIVSISQPTASGDVTVVVQGTNGTYTVTVNQHLVAEAGLTVGKTVSMAGVLDSSSGNSKDVSASQVEVDGKNYTDSSSSSSSADAAPKVAEDGNQSSTHGSAEVEKPDKSPDTAGSSKDSETPDKSTS